MSVAHNGLGAIPSLYEVQGTSRRNSDEVSLSVAMRLKGEELDGAKAQIAEVEAELAKAREEIAILRTRSENRRSSVGSRRASLVSPRVTTDDVAIDVTDEEEGPSVTALTERIAAMEGETNALEVELKEERLTSDEMRLKLTVLVRDIMPYTLSRLIPHTHHPLTPRLLGGGPR